LKKKEEEEEEATWVDKSNAILIAFGSLKNFFYSQMKTKSKTRLH